MYRYRKLNLLLINVTVPRVSLIVNKSLQSGHFPDSLKVAHIRPLLKETGLDEENLKNYRPVAYLTFLIHSCRLFLIP